MSVAPTESGFTMPENITLADVAAMAEGDEHHKYELTSEGVLVIMTSPSLEHQRIISRLIVWFCTRGFSPDQVVSEPGVFTGGGRQPDLTVWVDDDAAQLVESSYCGTAGLLVAIEVVSPSSRIEDKVRKREEYARAGIPRYWIVEQDQPQTVLMLALDDKTGEYESVLRSPQPLRWLLTTDPADYLGPRPSG
jgi:Uma2 family endonuclease